MAGNLSRAVYRWASVLALLLLFTATGSGTCILTGDSIQKYENFSRDPEWEGRGNHRIAGRADVVQDFG